MKVGSVKVSNFRSILDSDFNLSSGVTALTGGNESGKSNVLLCLEKFLAKTKFEESDIYQLSKDTPQIEVTFNSFSVEELETLKSLLKVNTIKELIIRRVGDEYEIVKPVIPEIESKKSEEKSEEIAEEPTNSETSVAQEFPPEQTTKNEEEPQNEQQQLTASDIKDKVIDLLPEVEYIRSVEDLIEGENIPISEIYPSDSDKIAKRRRNKLETIRALLLVGDIKEEDVKNSDLTARTKALQKGAARVGEQLRKSWQQEDIKLKIVADQENLVILFRDGKNRPKGKKQRENDAQWIWTLPEDRSTGFRWYVTFYVRYLAMLETSRNILFLVDDAGPALNKIAQEDLLKELAKKANAGTDVQIVYTTHSSHMVKWDFKKDIRLVDKKRGLGTKVEDMWWENYSPKDLPSPLSEIGFVWEEDVLSNDNIILEGMTDVYVFHNLPIKFTPDLKPTPYEGFKVSMAGKASKIRELGLLCKLKRKRSFLLYDADSIGLKYKADALELKERGKLDLDDIATIAESSVYKMITIEDLLPASEILKPLNKYGRDVFKQSWNDIQRLMGVGTKGFIELIKERLISTGLPEDQVKDFLRTYKYIIIVETIGAVNRTSYKNEAQLSTVIEFFKRIQKRLKDLTSPE